MTTEDQQIMPAMDATSAKLLIDQIQTKKAAINTLVARIERVRATERLILEEQKKAQQC